MSVRALVQLLASLLLLTGTASVATVSISEYPPLQPLIDAAKDGDVLKLSPGTYSGPVVVDKPITIDGGGNVTIDSGGRGTVLLLDTDGAVITNLRLTNSGASHNDIDAGVQVRGKYNVIKDNVIDNCLFGIDLQQSENNIVKRNTISSKPLELGMRGDAIRLWYSFGNKITDNVVRNSRDMVVWYSRDNTISRNQASGGRYALHFMYAQFNKVEENLFYDNSVGIFLMYSDSVVVRNNQIMHATGTTGVGIGFKETSDVTIDGNKILYCATGLYLDVSPYQPETTNRLTGNLVAYSGVGIRFLNDWTGNIFESNRFKGNITPVIVSGGGTANRNQWGTNFWDDYEGFDLNQDGIGDTPYEYVAYADRIWMDVPPAQFFKGTPMLEVLDFLERLAPFSHPNVLVRDARPVMSGE